jgi:hypothetical protein
MAKDAIWKIKYLIDNIFVEFWGHIFNKLSAFPWE